MLINQRKNEWGVMPSRKLLQQSEGISHAFSFLNTSARHAFRDRFSSGFNASFMLWSEKPSPGRTSASLGLDLFPASFRVVKFLLSFLREKRGANGVPWKKLRST